MLCFGEEKRNGVGIVLRGYQKDVDRSDSSKGDGVCGGSIFVLVRTEGRGEAIT